MNFIELPSSNIWPVGLPDAEHVSFVSVWHSMQWSDTAWSLGRLWMQSWKTCKIWLRVHRPCSEKKTLKNHLPPRCPFFPFYVCISRCAHLGKVHLDFFHLFEICCHTINRNNLFSDLKVRLELQPGNLHVICKVITIKNDVATSRYKFIKFIEIIQTILIGINEIGNQGVGQLFWSWSLFSYDKMLAPYLWNIPCKGVHLHNPFQTSKKPTHHSLWLHFVEGMFQPSVIMLDT